MRRRRVARVPFWGTRGLIRLGVVAAAIAGPLWSSSAWAQLTGGCVQYSPENPSLLLGLVGGAVAALPLLRARLNARWRK